MKRFALALVMPVILSACQSPATSKDACITAPLPQTTAQQVQAVQTHTTLLQRAGVIDQHNTSLTVPLTANSQRISLLWDGDAVELLAQLARQRGLHFVYTGTRLPLPVDINVQGMIFENLLILLREQIGWRATLTQNGTELHLLFSAPERGGRL
ncbi:DotD/TraH family lipoprotein [Klebsiella aerogenes]